jgi:hypothetical protein
VSDPVTYTAVLPVDEETVPFVSRLLPAEQRRRRTRRRRRALGCYRQAVLMLRWFLDGTRLAQLAADNRIGRSTAKDIAARIIQPVTRPSVRRQGRRPPAVARTSNAASPVKGRQSLVRAQSVSGDRGAVGVSGQLAVPS